MYCPAEQLEGIPIPPVSKLAQNSASLADTLMNADVSAPMRFVQVKTSLVTLRAQVKYSHIETNVRNKLSEEMLELQQLTQTGADQLTIMLASFRGALDKLRIYTQFALEDLSEVIHPKMSSDNNQLYIGYSEVEARNKLTKSFEDYMTSTTEQIDTVLFKAQEASMSLESIKDKLETIEELNFKGKHISQTAIDELEHGSL
ncbi:unnamed protein product [Rotaria magnacalcarata]|uniref:Uncharacterized protein n=1 Tax=Rotaria magnacalcarata TaxID=392030 RepID=A0A819YE40_9BILA|nr:unnamed protein product [Rotaria magnacalcarata]CAF2125358.1 unnamed protein product [Rotaria magnacalcarata]CAF4156057.1 unnamed protein product [Rotaria magnacalcarata]CAF4168470.1 unnamed protein product [Rotaria magnacalcarata]